MDVISFSKAKNAEKIAKAADARLTQALKDSKPIDQVSDALVDSKGNKSDTLKKRLDSRDVSVDASLNAINTQLGQSNRTTQVLQTGVNVVNSEVAAPATFQIEGRTLVNMGNSDLQDGKYYVLADKKTKVKAFKEDTWKQGVAKFQRENSLVTKANFAGKVTGSVVENPHIAKHLHSTTGFKPPTEYTAESLHYPAISVLENIRAVTGNMSQPSGAFASQVFSFNVIEHIERKIGLIPKTTIADKVRWAKDNIYGIIAKAHVKGAGPNGNKASMRFWNGSTWLFDVSHTSANVSMLANGGSTAVESYVMSDGFFHVICFADPSDGVTPSTIEMDYIELEVTLKSTAQLDKKPTFSRIANFEGKNDNPSAVPHYFRTTSGGTGAKTLQTTDSTMWVNRDSMTSTIERLNGVSFMNNTIVAEAISQQIFSFNIIEEVERNICKIPGNSTIEKVNWLKLNLNKYVFNWYGYGGGPSGNKVYIKRWIGSWFGETSHSSSNVSKLQSGTATPSSEIPADGIVHFLAFADPSDGVKDSYVYTDYAELEIELKADARIVNPFVPLYEVPKTEYDQILLEWNETEVLNRYPKVEGMQHLQNPTMIAEGENLLPPFNEWTLHANTTIKGPYELELNSTARYQASIVVLPSIPNQNYVFSLDNYSNDLGIAVNLFDYQMNRISVPINTLFNSPKVVTTTSNTKFVQLSIFNSSPDNGKFMFVNPSVYLGTKTKPFSPRNPSYLFTQVKLGQIGDKKDTLYKDNGEWKVRKEVEKDIILDGSLAWTYSIGFPGEYKRVHLNPLNSLPNSGHIVDNLGSNLKYYSAGDWSGISGDYYQLPGSHLRVTISNSKSGWASSFNPDDSDVKRYFNGWKYTDGTTWTSVTGNGQTATAATALTTKPTDYTPYKLSYVLATPKTETVNDKVEGDIVLSGLTQIDVSNGVVSREKVIPKVVSGTFAHINYKTDVPSQTKNKTQNIFGVYKDGILDKDWVVEKSNTAWKTEGSHGMYITLDKYDPKASYSVSYLVLQKEKFTTNNIGTKVIYSRNLRDAHDDLARQLKDTSTQLSVTNKMIIDLYVQLKALKS